MKTQNTKKFKKGFHTTIKNLDNNETIVNSDTRAIIGAFHNGDHIRGIGLTSCNTEILTNTIDTAEKCVNDMKKKMIESIPAEVLLAMLLGGER